MTSYGQFCPVAKATELIGEKWTVLVVRELLLGTTRFNDFQRAISRMSPTLLAKRLKHLEEGGIIIRKKLSGRKGYEYRLNLVLFSFRNPQARHAPTVDCRTGPALGASWSAGLGCLSMVSGRPSF